MGASFVRDRQADTDNDVMQTTERKKDSQRLTMKMSMQPLELELVRDTSCDKASVPAV